MDNKRRKGEFELHLRVTLDDPPEGVLFCLQAGKDELLGIVRATGKELSFDLSVRAVYAGKGKAPNFLGPFTQGPPAKRFFYIRSGTSAGDAGSCWSRRAKVPLTGITGELIDRIRAHGLARLEARIKGTAKDGGPACASVPLLDGWRIVP